MVQKEILCIISLSLAFMLLFAADSTLVNMQKTLIFSIQTDQPGFKVEGYASVGIVYILFSISVWFGPYLCYALGPKLAMVLAALGYLGKIVAFLFEKEWLIYVGAVLNGIGAGVLWPAQGNYLISNSLPETTPRNISIFWFTLSTSGFFGNIFAYLTFHGKKHIGRQTRSTTIYILSGISTAGVILFMLLPKSISKKKAQTDYGPLKTIKKSFSILTSSKMMWLVITFIYAGLQQSFSHGIYSSSIGFTLGFGNSAKELVALSGMFLSVGSLLGTIWQVIFSGWIRKQRHAHKMIVSGGIAAQLCTYAIAYVNLPNSAVFGNTLDQSIIRPSVVLAMVGSVLLCVGEACLNTQVYSIIGDCYRENSAEACALFKFVKSVSVAASFFWCNHLGLHTQVMVMSVMAGFAVVAVIIADRDQAPIECEETKTDQSTCKDNENSI